VAVAAVAAVGLGACGDDEGGAARPSDADAVADCGRARVVAEDLAWDPACLEVPADVPVVVEVVNRDDGVNHNLHLPDAPGGPSTELAAGPVVQELALQLPAGTYRYVCDIHPTMVGELRAGGQPGP